MTVLKDLVILVRHHSDSLNLAHRFSNCEDFHSAVVVRRASVHGHVLFILKKHAILISTSNFMFPNHSLM